MRIASKFDGYSRDGIRTYHKGGGDPSAYAREQEADRQARVTSATDAINAIFNGQQANTGTKYVAQNMLGHGTEMSGDEYQRQLSLYNQAQAKYQAANQGQAYTGEQSMADHKRGQVQQLDALTPEEHQILRSFNPNQVQSKNFTYYTGGSNERDQLYGQQRDAVYEVNKLDVDRQAAEAERAARFGLARSGLMGGSADIDAKADINRRTNEGLLRAGGIADQSAADLKAADERTRSNLISMAQSGIDTGSASTMALQGLKSNAESVASAKAGATVGGLFNDMGQAYLYNQGGLGRSAGGGQQPGQQWYGVSAPQQTYSGSNQ